MNQSFEGEYAAHVYIGVAIGINVYVGVHTAEKMDKMNCRRKIPVLTNAEKKYTLASIYFVFICFSIHKIKQLIRKSKKIREEM